MRKALSICLGVPDLPLDIPKNRVKSKVNRGRVFRVLASIIADLDELGGFPPITQEKEGKVEDEEARRIRYWRRLAAPDSTARE